MTTQQPTPRQGAKGRPMDLLLQDKAHRYDGLFRLLFME